MIIDFTGTVPGSKQFDKFGDDVTALIRNSEDKTFVIVDKGTGFKKAEPFIVSDHINLTGTNPLVGPNDPCGDRFPVVKDVYMTDSANGLSVGIAAGLKPGYVPSAKDLELLRGFGCDFCCYNLVPAMIIAAHAHKRVVGLVIPDGVNAEAIVSKLVAR